MATSGSQPQPRRSDAGGKQPAASAAPLSTRIGMVRQLASPHGRSRVSTVKGTRALVVGDTRSGLAELAGELAAELELPCLEIPALARSVYFTTRENQVIREELYGAVASVLAFVLALGRGERPELPPIEVPVALRFDADGRPEESP